jgi:serine/threonine protein kinase
LVQIDFVPTLGSTFILSLICYELPSKQTLDVFLKMNNQGIAEVKAYYILNGLIQAIDYLSSKKIVLHSVLPQNIILVESPQVRALMYFIFSFRIHRNLWGHFDLCSLLMKPKIE